MPSRSSRALLRSSLCTVSSAYLWLTSRYSSILETFTSPSFFISAFMELMRFSPSLRRKLSSANSAAPS